MVRAFLDAHQAQASKIVVVTDAGMLSADNLAALDEAGLGSVVGPRTSKAPYDLAEHIETFGNDYDDGQVTRGDHSQAPTHPSQDQEQ